MFHVKHSQRFYKKLSGEASTDVINYIQRILCKTVITWSWKIHDILICKDVLAQIGGTTEDGKWGKKPDRTAK